jgi:hypothetical protein
VYAARRIPRAAYLDRRWTTEAPAAIATWATTILATLDDATSVDAQYDTVVARLSGLGSKLFR